MVKHPIYWKPGNGCILEFYERSMYYHWARSHLFQQMPSIPQYFMATYNPVVQEQKVITRVLQDSGTPFVAISATCDRRYNEFPLYTPLSHDPKYKKWAPPHHNSSDHEYSCGISPTKWLLYCSAQGILWPISEVRVGTWSTHVSRIQGWDYKVFNGWSVCSMQSFILSQQHCPEI